MAVAKTWGSAVYGVNAAMITIELTMVQGTKFFMVGLPDNAIKESQHRIESTLKHINYTMPRQRIIVNLAPADIRKEGAAYDLPIALCILQASKQSQFSALDNYVVMGELGLNGQLRPIRGVLPIAIAAQKKQCKGFVLPQQNAQEAAMVKGLDIIPVQHITEAIGFFLNSTQTKTIVPVVKDTRKIFFHNIDDYDADFSDVQGQENIKRALEIRQQAAIMPL